MNTLNYHIEYDQYEKGHQWLEIAAVEHFFFVYILDIQVKNIIFKVLTTMKTMIISYMIFH
jgi:hypothetical protein